MNSCASSAGPTIFSTVGFGDITANSEAAQVVLIVQMLGDLALFGRQRTSTPRGSAPRPATNPGQATETPGRPLDIRITRAGSGCEGLFAILLPAMIRGSSRRVNRRAADRIVTASGAHAAVTASWTTAPGTA